MSVTFTNKKRLTEKYKSYYEPVKGVGTVTFELLPANALINEINKALINIYKQICNAPEAFLKNAKRLDEEMRKNGKKYDYFFEDITMIN